MVRAGADKDKLKIYPDFTLFVGGEVPENLNYLKGRVCIIPNKKMITHTTSDSSAYLQLLQAVIRCTEKNGKEVFILNHEGDGDLELCNQLNASFDNRLVVISGLNAKQVKGVIGNSYMVLSSRFHGVASALSQVVPCLSTSWNHKYKMLFQDYKLDDMVMDMQKPLPELESQFTKLLTTDQNNKMRIHLNNQKQGLSDQIDRMWKEVYEIMESKTFHNFKVRKDVAS